LLRLLLEVEELSSDIHEVSLGRPVPGGAGRLLRRWRLLRHHRPEDQGKEEERQSAGATPAHPTPSPIVATENTDHLTLSRAVARRCSPVKPAGLQRRPERPSSSRSSCPPAPSRSPAPHPAPCRAGRSARAAGRRRTPAPRPCGGRSGRMTAA